MRPAVAVVGAGWSGAVVARELVDAGVSVEVFERDPVVGGHARAEALGGVVYEPNGAHIFHTSDERVANYVRRFGLVRPYEHRVIAEVFLSEDDDEGVLLSWPPQIDELRELPVWREIEAELGRLPDKPGGGDFATYVLSMMGPTLYRMFIEGYTVKQWGCDPSSLSSRLAPRRVELRSDGYTRLFRDRWEFFSPTGVNGVVEAILAPVAVTCGADIRLGDVADLATDAVVITAPLDDLVQRPGELEWRGIAMRSRYVPVSELDGTVTPAYVVNRPSLRVPYTRTVETKHATSQKIAATVVSEEYPGADARHYPVPTVDRKNETRNEELKDEIREAVDRRMFFCGRLANYTYINQDEAVGEALSSAQDVQALLR